MTEGNSPRFMHCSFDFSPNKYINLLHIGWEKCKPNYSYVNHRNIYLIHYIKSGKGILQTNNSKHLLSSGCVFLIRPYQLATYTADNEEPWEYYYFAFNGDLAEELIANSCFKDTDTCQLLKKDTFSKKIVDAVYEYNTIQENSFLSLKYLFDLFHFFSAIPPDKKHNTISKNNNYVSIIEEYIMFNYSKPILISDLSKMVGLNRSHLLRTFKSNTGKSIEEFIIGVRMQEAQRFLRETDFPITNISRLIGYNNYPSFFRMFKNFVGVTPTEYRVSHSLRSEK